MQPPVFGGQRFRLMCHSSFYSRFYRITTKYEEIVNFVFHPNGIFIKKIVISDNYLHIRLREVKGLYLCIFVIGFPIFVIVKGRERFYRVGIRSLGFTEKKVVHENVRKE